MIQKFRAYTENYGVRKVCALTYTRRGIYVSLENGTGNYIRTKNFELMQNTTFRDRNNIEIYEGDIIETISEFAPEKAIIKFNGLEFYLEYIVKNLENESLKDISIDLEVIGNIYENKELL